MITNQKKSKIAWLLAFAMIINLFISSYILMQEISISSGNSSLTGDTCFFNSTTTGAGDCFKVQSSVYSSFLGVPIAGWGIIIFLFMAMALGAYAESIKNNKPIPYYEQKHFNNLLSIAFGLAILFALWFIYAQLFLIEAICRYCFVLDIITIFSAVSFFITFKRD